MRKQVVTPAIALLMLLPCGYHASHAADNAVDEDWPAIENCLGIIRGCQMPDGMIRMKGGNSPVWTVPYFGNLAAMALLAANDRRQNAQDAIRVERWLIWYARNQEADGTIFDLEGTVQSYKSNGKRDATDSYAATFLMATWRYAKAVGQHPSPDIVDAAKKALTVIDAVVQNDGLTIAKPEYPIKYLMDNIEVYQGLTEGALFFGSVGLAEQSRKAEQMALRVAGSLGKYWSEEDHVFAFALDMKDKASSGLTQSYPHGLAQLFALSYMSPARPELWTRVRHTFTPGDEGVPIERWLIAAEENAEEEVLGEIRRATRNAALRFAAEDVYLERPAMAVIALLGVEARFPCVPSSPGQDGPRRSGH